MGLSHVETEEALERLGLEVDELRASRERMARADDAERRSSRARAPRRHAAAPRRSCGQHSARARALERDPVPRSSSSTTWGETSSARSRRPRGWPSGSTHRSSRRAGSRQRLRAAAMATGVRTEIGPAVAQLPPDDRREPSYFCWLDALEAAPMTVDWRRSPSAPTTARRRSRSEGPADRFPTRCLNGCAIASRPRRGADDRVASDGWTACAARSRSSDDVRRSRPGRGSRP